jgi:hypothetical protein
VIGLLRHQMQSAQHVARTEVVFVYPRLERGG